MTMVELGSHHYQLRPSCPELKDLVIASPARVSAKEANLSNAAYLKESSVHDFPVGGLESRTTSLAFVYGTLKKGFGNYWVMEEELKNKRCRLIGTAHTKGAYPLVCGPYGVPFLLNVPGSGEHVRGEVYQVDSQCLARLDELEGTTKGYYVRCPIKLAGFELDPSFKQSLPNDVQLNNLGEVKAEAYFAAPGMTPGLYRAPHIEAYTEKESARYVRRIHRPPHLTSVQHVYHWIDELQKSECLDCQG